MRFHFTKEVTRGSAEFHSSALLQMAVEFSEASRTDFVSSSKVPSLFKVKNCSN